MTFQLSANSEPSLHADFLAPPASQGKQNVEVFLHPDQLPPDVQQLFSRAEQEDFQLGVPWLRNLVNTVFPGHDGVRFYVLRREGRPMAVLPVLATKVGLGWQVQSLSNYYTSRYAPVMAPEFKDHDLALLIKAVLKAHAPVVSLRFTPMDPDSRAYGALQTALRANGFIPFKFFCFGNWYLRVSCDWSNYLKERSGVLRSTIKRMSKKLWADGGTMELIKGGAGLAQGIAAYEQIYASSWKKSEPYASFIPGLMQMCSEQGVLRLGLAKIHDKPIAAQLWMVAHGKASIFKLAYDEEYKAYAPGTLISAMLMHHVLENDQVTEVDYLTGDDPYKKTWMSHRRERWGIIAYNPKTLRGVFGLSKEIFARTLKPLVARVRTLNRWVPAAAPQRLP